MLHNMNNFCDTSSALGLVMNQSMLSDAMGDTRTITPIKRTPQPMKFPMMAPLSLVMPLMGDNTKEEDNISNLSNATSEDDYRAKELDENLT